MTIALAPLRISIVSGIGRGRTLLSSFDDALHACGALNYNLIALSSVIPPAAEVALVDRFEPPGDEHGHRLYVVKAERRSARPGAVIGAGIGWVQWGDGRGVFVEHEAVGATRPAVAADLTERLCWSLSDLCRVRGVPFEENRIGSRLSLAEVEDRPTTALVLAVYQSEGWGRPVPPSHCVAP